jgi:DME family drug/metabolite transporter
VLVAAATAVRTRSRPSPRTVLALALALAGLVLLVGGSGAGAGADDAASAGRPVLSALVALVCAAAFAAMTVVNREPVPGLAPLVLTGASFTLGAVLLLPVVLVVGMGHVVSWPAVVWLGVGPTALAYAAYFSGLRSVPGTTASLLALLEPLTAALGAALLRDERLGWAGLAGGLLLLLAIVVLRPVRLTPTMARGLP